MSTRSWVGLWSPLLCEAQALAQHSRTGDLIARSAAAIILARTAWDCFINEFIELRRLPRELKLKDFNEKIAAVLAALDQAPPTYHAKSVWADLDHVNALRNAIVHHRAEETASDAQVARWFGKLDGNGLVSGRITDPWERRCLNTKVAVWCCEVVGTAIVALEQCPKLRRRSLDLVRAQVQHCLKKTAH